MNLQAAVEHSFVASLALVGHCWLLFGCSQAPQIDGDDGAGATGSDSSGTSSGGAEPNDESGSQPGTSGDGDSGSGTGDTGDDETDPEPPPDPDAAGNLFSHDYLPVYRITMQGSNWAEAWDFLMGQLDPVDKCADRPFSEASVAFENPWTGETEHYDQVGFRIRGHDLPAQILAQPDERFGFKMSFATFLPGRRFHGHKQINFLSSERDDTLLRQCLTYELMRDFDIPVARCNFASVYVNGDYVGVFAHAENNDDGSYPLNRFADDPTGSMYQFGDCWGDDDDVLMDLGPDAEPYVETYQLEAGTTELDVAADLIPFLQCASAPDQEFIACIEAHIDLDEWHRAMAAHFAIPEMDGWAPSSGNFVLYHHGPQGEARRFVVFPWDVDRAFKDDCDGNDGNGNNAAGPCHILGYSWEDGVSPELVNRLREPPFRSGYCDAAQAFVDQHYHPAAMAARMNELRNQPRQAAQPFEGLTDPSLADLMDHDPLWELARFDEDFAELLDELIPDRHAALLEQLSECEVSPLIAN